MQRRRLYRVAGESLLVEAQDAWSQAAIDALFAGWYLTPDEAADEAASVPGIVMSSGTGPAAIPSGLDAFSVAGGGTCHTDGTRSYVDIEGSVVAIGKPGVEAIDVRMAGPLPVEAPAVTRVVTYALAAALRHRRRFELHSAALVQPESGEGVLIVGPSGSGKSTMSVHLASAGWPFLTDDVVLLGEGSGVVVAWPLRRCFAVTTETVQASRVLREQNAPEQAERRPDDKRPFLPHEVFAGGFRDRCEPRTLLFPTRTGADSSHVERLSAGETMTRLVRMSPWSCYDRSTASSHLAVLSMLATQASAYRLLAGRDLLDSDMCVNLIAHCVRGNAPAS